MGSSLTRARTRVPCIGRWILNHRATREASKTFSTAVILPIYIYLTHMAASKLDVSFSFENCMSLHSLAGEPWIYATFWFNNGLNGQRAREDSLTLAHLHHPSQNMRHECAPHYCQCWTGLDSQVLSLVTPGPTIMVFLFSLIVIFLYNSVSFCEKEPFRGRILTWKNWKIMFMLSKNTVFLFKKRTYQVFMIFRKCIWRSCWNLILVPDKVSPPFIHLLPSISMQTNKRYFSLKFQL